MFQRLKILKAGVKSVKDIIPLIVNQFVVSIMCIACRYVSTKETTSITTGKTEIVMFYMIMSIILKELKANIDRLMESYTKNALSVCVHRAVEYVKDKFENAGCEWKRTHTYKNTEKYLKTIPFEFSTMYRELTYVVEATFNLGTVCVMLIKGNGKIGTCMILMYVIKTIMMEKIRHVYVLKRNENNWNTYLTGETNIQNQFVLHEEKQYNPSITRILKEEQFNPVVGHRAERI